MASAVASDGQEAQFVPPVLAARSAMLTTANVFPVQTVVPVPLLLPLRLRLLVP